MIAKITKGCSFKGAVNYILDQSKGTKLLSTEGVRTLDNKSIIDSFITQSKLNPSLKKSVGHISLSFSSQDKTKLTDHFILNITKDYMLKMGIVNTQYLIARHHDKEHPHVHLCFNRVDNNGQTISDKNDRHRSSKIAKELTLNYGLYYAKGKERVKIHRLKEPDRTKYEIYDALKQTIKIARNWDQLKYMLAQQNIQVVFKMKGKTDEVQGVRFAKNDYVFNGSKIDREFSYNKIDFALKQNDLDYTLQENISRVEHSQGLSIGNTALKALLDVASSEAHSESENNEQNNKQKKRRGFKR